MWRYHGETGVPCATAVELSGRYLSLWADRPMCVATRAAAPLCGGIDRLPTCGPGAEGLPPRAAAALAAICLAWERSGYLPADRSGDRRAIRGGTPVKRTY